MSYYSDPTAARALGPINREFSKYIKRAKRLCKLCKEGRISADTFDKAHAEFRGIYKHVLDKALAGEYE
ncbi:MAG: hypothetical protein IJZ15_02405 [Oscillospiraceae bacterium]|nr:hypothetical protein [Oscillospiraceae bacterium]